VISFVCVTTGATGATGAIGRVGPEGPSCNYDAALDYYSALSSGDGPYPNPNTPWAAGFTVSHSPRVTGFTQFNASGSHSDFRCYYNGPAHISIIPKPNLCQYFGANGHIPYRDLSLWPPAKGLSVLRFYAPASGTYRIAAKFEERRGKTNAYISFNGVDLLQAFEPVNITSLYTNAGIFLYQGQYLDFAVSSRDKNGLFDQTPLQVLIQDTRCIGATGSPGPAGTLPPKPIDCPPPLPNQLKLALFLGLILQNQYSNHALSG
jgi:hypothetical protein